MMNVEECLVCRTFPAENRQAFIKHCCQHMEEFALMAMPEIADDRSEGDEDNPNDDRSIRSSGHCAYISSSNDAQPSRRDAEPPAVASMKHITSEMTETASAAIPKDTNPMVGDDGRPHIDPTSKLLGGSQTEKERSRTKIEVATHKPTPIKLDLRIPSWSDIIKTKQKKARQNEPSD